MIVTSEYDENANPMKVIACNETGSPNEKKCDGETTYKGRQIHCMLAGGHPKEHYNFLKVEDDSGEKHQAVTITFLYWKG